MHLGVLSYDYDPPIGGLGIVAKAYALALPKHFQSIRTTVFSPTKASDSFVLNFASLRWKKSGGCPFFSLVLNFTLPFLVSRSAIDVLHVHAGSGGAFLLFRQACPIVVTAHHTYRQEVRLLFKAQPFKRFWKYLLSFLERRTYHIANLITCVSYDTAEALIHDYGIDPKKVLVLENAVDDTFFHRPSSVDASNVCSIVYVGRVEERKGVSVLLSAFSAAAKELPSLQLTLVGQNLLGDRLQKTILDLGILNRIHTTGWLPQNERIKYMKEATIIVVPSILEGFGLVAAEAMALGVPVVVSNCPGLRCLVKDLSTGLLFESGSAVSLKDQILYALNHKEEMKKMAMNASLEARERFVLYTQVQKLGQLLVGVMKNPNK